MALATSARSDKQCMRKLPSGMKKPSQRCRRARVGWIVDPPVGGGGDGSGLVGGRWSISDAKTVEPEGVVGVGMVSHEDQHPEIVSQDVGQLEP